MKDLYGFVFKLLLLCVTLYFTCEFALNSKTINTRTGIFSLIGLTILVCIVFWFFRCNPEGEISAKNKPRKDILDFVLKLLLLSITIYFICDFAEKSIDAPSFFGNQYIDLTGQSWQEINLQLLAHQAHFLTIGA